MEIKTLEDKFIHELYDMYDAEHRFLDAQKKMVKSASVTALQTMIREHIDQTEGQIKILEEVFDTIRKQPKRVKCDGAAGLISEAEKGMENAADPAVRDCLIAGSAHKAEQYEIVSYRGMISLAQHLGYKEAATLLRKNLLQEEQTAQRIEQSEPALLKLADRAMERGGK